MTPPGITKPSLPKPHGLTTGRFIAVVAVSVALACPAHSQVRPQFPKSKLIDGLVERGMTTLIDHLVATDPPDDPAEAGELIYRVHLSRWEDGELDLQMRIDELGHAEEKMLALIEAHGDHESRPIWQTDLAGILLFARLDMANVAGLFYEFAVPTAEQRLVVERSAGESLEHLSDALQRLFVLQGELPKQEDHVQNRVNTGRWDRMMNQYFELRTRFYTGQACLNVALLDDGHPFYRSLNKPNSKLRLRGKTVADERARVVRMGIEHLEDFVRNPQDPHGVYAGSLSLTARLLLVDQRPDEALRHLNLLTKLPELPPVADLVMQMTMARAIHRMGRTGEGIERLEALLNHELARGDPLIRLLVVDCTHRMLMAEAEAAPETKRRAAVQRAYTVYDVLMNDPSLGSRASDMRSYIYRRWTAGMKPGQDLSALPPMVLRAVGRQSAEEAGMVLGQSNDVHDPKQRDQLRDEAQAKYRRTIEVCRELLRRAPLRAEDEAEAHYLLALATHHAGSGERSTTIDAVRRWTDLAGQQPDQGVAEQAISHAVNLARPLLLEDPDDEQVQQLYEQATSVLFDKFAQIPAADVERIHYAQIVLIPKNKFEQAVTMLAGIERRENNSQTYYAAQSEVLFCLKRMIDLADDTERPRLALELRNRVRRLKEDIASIQSGESGTAAATAMALAQAHTAMAAVLRQEGKHQAAADELRSVEGLDVPAPVRHAARGDLISSLVELGHFEKVQADAKRLMDTAPGDAAPVIYNVLERIGQRSNALRREAALPDTTKGRRTALLEESQLSAGAAVTLAQLLLAWAQEQPELTQARISEFHIIEARAQTVAGMSGAAVTTLTRIREQPEFANDLMLLDALADAHFQAGERAGHGQGTIDDGRRQSLVAAADVLDTILTGVEPDDNGPYPAEWWHAWVRRLRINEILGEGTQDIPFRVRQLRLTDPMLGGEPYRSQLQRLENKHALGG